MSHQWKPWAVLGTCVLAAAAYATPPRSDFAALHTQVRKAYPSLRYVERYRAAFPAEAQGLPFWRSDATARPLSDAADLTRTLAALEDQHVALVGDKAGHTETLGTMFRTAADGSVIVWRVFDPVAAKAGLAEGQRVLAIDGTPSATWLRRAASLTFAGQRRARYAEAATELGLATPVVHRVAGLGAAVVLRVADGQGRPRNVTVRYRPVDGALAKAMTLAIDRPDLPEQFRAAGLRVATLRLGAFAPQYDDTFNHAADAAAARPGTSDDAAMVAGYCAVVRKLIGEVDAHTRDADVLVVDLRGNLGGFDREAWLLADALAGRSPPATLDLFPTDRPGTVRLVREKADPSCGHLTRRLPLVVLTDAGTRSAGEFMASWLWAAGAVDVGESTEGAGGGFTFDAKPPAPLPSSGYAVRLSGNFSLFDPTGALAEGDHSEAALVDVVARDGFAPSRTRPFAIQSVGLRPDLPLATTAADLADGGRARLVRALATLKARGELRALPHSR